MLRLLTVFAILPAGLMAQACTNPGSGNVCSPVTINTATVAKHGNGTAADGSWALLNLISDNNSGDQGCYSSGQINFSLNAATITMATGGSYTCGASNITQKSQTYLSGSMVWKNLNYKPSEMSSGHVFISVRAQLGRGWPAIWLLGGAGNTSGAAGCQFQSINNTWDNVGNCNWSQDGSAEIDIEEATESGGYTSGIQHNVFLNGTDNGVGQSSITNATTNFHTYTLDWSNSALTYQVDGSGGGTINGGSPQQSMFLIIENRVNLSGAPPGGAFPTVMTVQWVQVCDGTSCTAPQSAGGNTVFFDNFQAPATATGSGMAGSAVFAGNGAVK